MTSRTTRRVGSAAIERRRAKINAEIPALGLPLPPAAWSNGGPAAATPAATATATRRSCTGRT